MLSATVAPEPATASIQVSPEIQVEATTGATIAGLTPSEVSTAYGFSGLTFGASKVAANGAGQTIAIIDAYNDPNIKSDLATFDAAMGLSGTTSSTVPLTVVNQNGGTSLPQTDAGWDLEIALDVEWAHAIAPGANIVLVEANSDNLTDLLSAVKYAETVPAVSVISMSWGSSEFSGETSYDSYFTTPAGHQGITFVGASGDDGSPGIWPAASTNVLAVGGTTLSVSSAGVYQSETAWSDSGGGTSPYESEPAWQKSVQSTGLRTSPDVSYDANPNSGFAVYDSVSDGGKSGWSEVGGTSDAAPQWAALIAIANQGRVAAGETTLNGAQAAIYSLPSTDFHDITSGSNGGYKATKGYDEVTGIGSPIANLVINGLVSYSTSSSSSGSSGSSSSGTSGSGSSGSGGSGGGGSFGGGFHNPFSGFGGFGGIGGFGGFFSGYFGRLDEIADAPDAPLVQSFVASQVVGADVDTQTVTVAVNPLVGIQATTSSTGAAVGQAPLATTDPNVAAAPAKFDGFAQVESSAAASDGGAVVSRAVASGVRRLDASTQNSSPVDSTQPLAPPDGSVKANTAAAGDASSAAVVSPSILLGQGELSPAIFDAAWSGFAGLIDEPATDAFSTGELVSDEPMGAAEAIAPVAAAESTAGETAFVVSSPLMMAAVGVALSWAKERLEAQTAKPGQPWARRSRN